MKAYSKGAKRRAKKSLDLPTLAGIPKREIDGKSTRRKRTDPKPETGADIVALGARARLIGKEILPEQDDTGRPIRKSIEANKAVRADMRAQTHGEAAGRAIALTLKGDKATRAHEAYRGLTAAEQRYHRLVLGQSIHPKTAKLEMMPERVEADPDHAPDLRTDEERTRAAVSDWMRWKGYTQHLSADQRMVIWNASRDAIILHRGDVVTPQGRAFVAAIIALADVVAGA